MFCVADLIAGLLGQATGQHRLVGLFCRRIRAEHLDEFRDLTQMAQGIANDMELPGIVEDVRVEVVLPRPATNRTRLDFAEREIAQRKNAQSLEESARDILQRESHRSLIGPGQRAAIARNKKESSEILFVILQSALEDMARVLSRCLPTGDCRRMLKLVPHHMLHGASRVIKRYRLDFAVPAEKITTLVEGHRMGKDPTQIRQPYPWRGNQVVLNAQSKFTLNESVRREQKIEMFGHGSGQRVFNGNDCTRNLSRSDSFKNVHRNSTGDDAAAGQHVARCFVAERANFALDRDIQISTELRAGLPSNTSGTQNSALSQEKAEVTCCTEGLQYAALLARHPLPGTRNPVL